MDHKNQNDPPPDYSFILNQAGQAPAKAKKVDKKLIIIGVLLGLTFIIFIAGILLSAKKRVVNNNSSNNKFTPATRQTEVTDVPGAFLNYVSNSKDTEAAALMNSDLQKGQANGTFTNSIGAPFRQNIDLSTCKKNQGTDANTVSYTCQMKNALLGTVTITMQLGNTSVNGKQTQEITKLNWSVKK